MHRDHTVGVVVPAYNEAGFVGDVILEMPAFVDRIYVVDDASTDDTWEEVLEAARRDQGRLTERETELERIDSSSRGVATDGGGLLAERAAVHSRIGRVVPIQHDENRGAGGAIKTGYLAALDDGVEITVTVDGDGQMDTELLPRFLDPIVEGTADYVKGNRLLYKEYRREMSKWRFLGNSILTFLTKIASGYWKMMDPQNGYTAISKYALENVAIADMYEYYGYCNDLLVKLNAKGMRVADVAMPAKYGDEQSHITYSTYIRKVSFMLLRNFLWRLKVRYLVLDFHPLALFYYFGAVTSALGLVGGVWSVYVWTVFGHSLFVRGSLSLLLFITGSMFLMFAMLFDMQANEDREVQIYD